MLEDLITPERPLALVGCGRMGGAMLAGWRQAGLADRAVRVVTRPASPGAASAGGASSAGDALSAGGAGEALAGVPVLAGAAALAGQRPSLVVLAVKPQQLAGLGPDLAAALDARVPVISVLAGVPLAGLAAALGDRPLIRAMPNTPAAIGRGVTSMVANAAGAPWLDRARTLLGVLGSVVVLAAEEQMDAATALAGSGPAYVFHLVEALAAAGVAEGLPEATARALARATVAGAGALLDADDRDAAALRQAVTSPGGTTQAGLDVLMRPAGLTTLMAETVHAATARSRALGRETAPARPSAD
ncbi:pyrroline-5-carboxylate reductase [Rhodothalassium salexigens DSM 2132]|uniref:Pyrroline-5-carboxylate reductase n=1 Tax=Rhodothalassium salexigens DSM 2132 TaxID=1188247 RepID=A0A4R2PE01_RHOSA|nr:pyrroline-5-carboxylate reductase [Rhodothalassium salexigens]MBB4211946.1 pyrroline-5-carboxylate reductase [Rhodothalassium salexigens DSM 2132]MBK1638608.1 pyrroline-5-carboxylate reductase [Rhodothalassium salexigens DSM 2132]TCP33470.1 pyrroline-5-carboxylate reductase [Rhodothalassium salexigens DSM 2132]